MGRSKHSQLDSAARTKPGRDSDEFGMLQETQNGYTVYANDVRGGMGTSYNSLSDEETGRKGGIQVTTMYEVRSHQQD